MAQQPGNYDLRNEEEAKEYLENLGIEYRFQCYHEKIPDGCHRLADFLEAFKRDEVRARKVFLENCENNNHGHSCFKVGQYNLTGIAGEKNLAEAYKYFIKGCDLSYGASCHNAGLLEQLGKGSSDKPDFIKASHFLKLGCDLDNIPSCHYLSSYYLTGKPDIPQNLYKAFEMAKKACDAGHIYSCVNLSIMYKKGEGTDKNPDLSDKYEARAKQLYQEQTIPEANIKFGQ